MTLVSVKFLSFVNFSRDMYRTSCFVFVKFLSFVSRGRTVSVCLWRFWGLWTSSRGRTALHVFVKFLSFVNLFKGQNCFSVFVKFVNFFKRQNCFSVFLKFSSFVNFFKGQDCLFCVCEVLNLSLVNFLWHCNSFVFVKRLWTFSRTRLLLKFLRLWRFAMDKTVSCWWKIRSYLR